MSAGSDRIREVQRGVERLRAELRVLRQQVSGEAAGALRYALRRRGLIWTKVLHAGSLMPHSRIGQDEFYQLLRHYSFRLFLRDVIKHRDGFALDDLIRYCSPDSARKYLRWLLDRRLVRRHGRHFRLGVDAQSFGPTLEWFVAAVLEREYGVPAAWNVRLDEARGGGDYDVVGFQDGACIYIEAKSAPPRNIEARQVQAFFGRLETLRPDVAVFLNDTQLRMSDKIAVLFAAELRRRLGRRARRLTVERLDGQLFTVADRLFIANSEPDLVVNIGRCLAHHFRARGFQLNGRR